MDFLKFFIDSLAERGLITSIQSSGNKTILKSKYDTLYLTQGQTGWFIFSSSNPGKGVEIYSNRDGVVAKFLSNMLFGQVNASYQGRNYKNVTMYPVRALKNAVQFSTAKGDTFLVNAVDVKAVLGLYDLLYKAHAENVIAWVPGAINSSIDYVQEGSVSVRSEFLKSDCSCILNGIVVTPNSINSYVELNKALGDTTMIGSSAPKTEDLIAKASGAVLKIGSSCYRLGFDTIKGGIEYVFTGEARVNAQVVDTIQSSLGFDSMQLRANGVSIQNEDALLLLSSGVSHMKSTFVDVPKIDVSDKVFSGAEARSRADGWTSDSAIFKQVETFVAEY